MVELVPYLTYGFSSKLLIVIKQSPDDRIQAIGYFLYGFTPFVDLHIPEFAKY
jgi:hypothetical protein